MNIKILVLEKNGSSETLPLNKAKFVIGRDESCDIRLDDAAISRKHAVILVQFDQVYIENISTSGQILRGDEPVEYVQMDEEAEFHLGPFILYWKSVAQDQANEPVRARKSNDSIDLPEQAINNDPQATVPSSPQDMNDRNPFEANEPDPNAPNLEAIDANSNLPALSVNDSADDGFAASSMGAVDTGASTRVTGLSTKAILKIMKGEEIGRQIKLDYGFQWVVGRSPRSHVQINNGKLSRQHFKIYKVGTTYRVQDLGSSHGTKLNGVTVTDAPLQPFDTLQAGPVEIQYLLVDAKVSDSAMPDVGSPLVNNASSELGSPQPNVVLDSTDQAEKTQFAPPVPYSASPFQGEQVPNQEANLNFNFSGIDAGARAPTDADLNKAKGPIPKFVIWYKAQPKPRQISLMLVAFLVVASLIMLGLSDDSVPEVKVAVLPASQSSSSTTANATTLNQSSDISPEFDLLPEDQKLRIKDLYAKAERAKMAKEWQKAFDHASEIHRSVKRYKKTNDILLEAQSNLTDSNIGSLAPNLKDVMASQREVAEQVKVLCIEGEKAINEARWEDAMGAYQKGIVLDPNSDCAKKGYSAAFSKDPKMLNADLPKIVEAPKVSAEDLAIQRARDDMEGLKRQYASAKDRINQGKASESLPELYDLRDKLKDRLDGYSYGVRAPASIRDELLIDSKALMSRVDEGISAMKAKLKADYQVQLADAEQFIANKQYSTAREIYDRILESDPNFEEVIELREKLYTKIITEARNKYQEGLIYESVGDVDNAIEGYEKTRELLTNVNIFTATEYFSKASTRLGRLKR